MSTRRQYQGSRFLRHGGSCVRSNEDPKTWARDGRHVREGNLGRSPRGPYGQSRNKATVLCSPGGPSRTLPPVIVAGGGSNRTLSVGRRSGPQLSAKAAPFPCSSRAPGVCKGESEDRESLPMPLPFEGIVPASLRRVCLHSAASQPRRLQCRPQAPRVPPDCVLRNRRCRLQQVGMRPLPKVLPRRSPDAAYLVRLRMGRFWSSMSMVALSCPGSKIWPAGKLNRTSSASFSGRCVWSEKSQGSKSGMPDKPAPSFRSRSAPSPHREIHPAMRSPKRWRASSLRNSLCRTLGRAVLSVQGALGESSHQFVSPLAWG